MFTNRFLRLPIQLVDTEELEQAEACRIEPEYEDSFIKILPTQIESYRPTIGESLVNVTMKSGYHFICELTIKEFEKVLNAAE